MNTRTQDHRFSIFSWTLLLFAAPQFCLSSVHPAAKIRPDVAIATQLSEVQHGTHEGLDYLTLNIGSNEVGPASCRGSVLHLSPTVQRKDQIEALALSAMLSSEVVMIVVSMDAALCVLGKPVFTDLYLPPASL